MREVSMKTILAAMLSLVALISIVIAARAESLSAEDLSRSNIERRGIEAVIWGMAAVNTDLMLQAALKAGAKENEIVYWSRPVDWRNQTLTPNPDTIYLMPFFSTKAGPVVLEVPAAEGDNSVTANIDDIWQMALEDAGPAGADYLIACSWHVKKDSTSL
jgi:hypothetical protein